jgi:hypothetical protein
MNKLMTRAAETALAAGVAGGVLLLGSSVAGAQEAEPPTTAEGDGVLAGNAVNADVDVPVTLCGIAGALLGVANGTCDGAPAPPPAPDTTVAQASGDGVLTGNAVGLDLDAPITVCGVGVVGAGAASGTCNGGAAPAASGSGGGGGPGGGGDTTVAQAQGNGFLAGNAVGLDVDVPITVCGVGGALLGVASGTCALPPAPPGGPGGGDTVVAKAEGNGFLSGNAIGLNVDLPINICGIGVAVGGLAVGDCVMPAGGPLASTGSSTTTATASGSGFLTGNAIAADLDLPITACGVGVAGIGIGTGVCHVGPPPPPCKDECPPPCDHDCPPPPCKESCPPPPPPPGCKDHCAPPPPPHRSELPAHAPAQPIVHRTVVRGSTTVRTGQLPHTGATTDAALPLGTGLVAAGLAFVAAARRAKPARAGR